MQDADVDFHLGPPQRVHAAEYIPDLVLIRGIPGSGKSTMAAQLSAHGWRHLEVDQYMTIDGVYAFDKKRLQSAHVWCEEQARLALLAGERVVVSNVFPREFSMWNYFESARDAGVEEVKVIHATGRWQNVHGAPDDVVEMIRYYFTAMRERSDVCFVQSIDDLLAGRFSKTPPDIADDLRTRARAAVKGLSRDGRHLSQTALSRLSRESGVASHTLMRAVRELHLEGAIPASQLQNKRDQAVLAALVIEATTQAGRFITTETVREAVRCLLDHPIDDIQIDIAVKSHWEKIEEARDAATAADARGFVERIKGKVAQDRPYRP